MLEKLENLSLDSIVSKFNVKPFEVVNKASSQKDAVLFLGQLNDELVNAANKENALLINIKIYKPSNCSICLISFLRVFKQSLLYNNLPHQLLHLHHYCLIFSQNIPNIKLLKNFTKIVSATFGFVTDYTAAISQLLANTRSDNPKQNLSFGKVNTVLATKSSKKKYEDYLEAVSEAHNLEQAYLKVLQQINLTNLKVLNEFQAANAGLEVNPEFGFGSFLFDQEQQENLVSLVQKSIKENSFHSVDNGKLIELLSQWLVQIQDSGEVENRLPVEIVDLLKTDETTTTARELLALSRHFTTEKIG